MKKIKIVAKPAKTQDGKPFTSFKFVSENGRLIDLHFKKDVDVRLFDGMKKFTVECETFNDASDRYEFPRVYVGGINPESVVCLIA